MKCLNCGREMIVIDRNIQGLDIGWRCLNCGDEHWPYDKELPPEAFMEIVEESPAEIADKAINLGKQLRGIMDRLILARKRAGLSQGQVAAMVGFSRASSLADYENGRRSPTLDLFLRLCEIYGISPMWALTGTNPAFDATDILRAAKDANEDVMKIIDLLSSLG